MYHNATLNRFLGFFNLRFDKLPPIGAVSPGKLVEWDKGIFGSALEHDGIFPRPLTAGKGLIVPPSSTPKGNSIDSGTYHGTKIAISEIYKRIEQRFVSFFDVANFESSVPQGLTIEDKATIFGFQDPGSDQYPPHLALGAEGTSLIPSTESVSLLEIFNAMRLLDTGSLLIRIVPDNILDFVHGDPDAGGTSIQAIVDREREMRREQRDIYKEPCIGDRDDWYSDAVFAQMEFTGVNPTSIRTVIGTPWVARFKDAANTQKNAAVLDFIDKNADSLYVNDCSYFREAVGVTDQSALLASSDGHRWGCASVCLYHLLDTGALHPIGIVIDYRDSTSPTSLTMPNSVCIFNKRLSPSAKSTIPESLDYPWRYAKSCMQTSDWLHHELAVHLTNAHLMEESMIVSCHLTLPTTHAVYKLLEPHWLKTLSLNAAARATLIPGIAIPIAGATGPQVYAFIQDAYKRFNWVDHYIPNDLRVRGFPNTEEALKGKKWHNYAYAKNMNLMWNTLRDFVEGMLDSTYPTDADVKADKALDALTAMMRDRAQIPSFPDLNTRAAIFDAVTMCIHIASPQHTAVNYLQSYHQSFVPARTPALYTPPPTSLSSLQNFKERDLLDAWPLKYPREWLLASHIGYLLSSTVAQEQNLPNYAASLLRISVLRGDGGMEGVARRLLDGLGGLERRFRENSRALDDQVKGYDVMNPGVTAVSILI